jgi:replication factor C small subunit
LSRNPEVPRIVFMDEFDGMLGLAQDALRNIMETYYSNCRFILTANNDNKIIDPIKSRCFRVDLKNPSKEEIIDRLKYIAEKEGVLVESDEVYKKIVDYNYPSIRNCVKSLQMLSIGGKITVDRVKPELCVEEEIYALLKTGEFLKARTIWLEKGMDADDLLLNLYRLAVRDKMLTLQCKQRLVVEAAKYNSRMGLGDPELQLSAFGVELAGIVGAKVK